MTQLKVACIQMRSGVEIVPNIAAATALINDAADQGAQLIVTPEMTSLIDIRPGMARPKIVSEPEDTALAAFQALAKTRKVWLLIGSLAITLDDDPRLANRSFTCSMSKSETDKAIGNQSPMPREHAGHWPAPRSAISA